MGFTAAACLEDIGNEKADTPPSCKWPTRTATSSSEDAAANLFARRKKNAFGDLWPGF